MYVERKIFTEREIQKKMWADNLPKCYKSIKLVNFA